MFLPLKSRFLLLPVCENRSHHLVQTMQSEHRLARSTEEEPQPPHLQKSLEERHGHSPRGLRALHGKPWVQD